ncbi:MAG: DUF2157 domain-containing protein, partial [Bacilli bacterium]
MIIENKIQEWHERELIDAETAARLVAYEQSVAEQHDTLLKRRGAFQSNLLLALAFALIGGSLVFFISSNWGAIPIGWKMAMGYTTLAASAGLFIWGIYKNARAFLLFGGIAWHAAFAVQLIVTTQLYTFPSNPLSSFMMWMLSAFVISYVSRQQELKTIAVLVGTIILLYYPANLGGWIEGNWLLFALVALQIAFGVYVFWGKQTVAERLFFVPFLLVNGGVATAILFGGDYLFVSMACLVLLLPFVTRLAEHWAKAFLYGYLFLVPIFTFYWTEEMHAFDIQMVVFAIAHLAFVGYLYRKRDWEREGVYATLAIANILSPIVIRYAEDAVMGNIALFFLISFSVGYVI